LKKEADWSHITEIEGDKNNISCSFCGDGISNKIEK
jgi:hypothetical protein